MELQKKHPNPKTETLDPKPSTGGRFWSSSRTAPAVPYSRRFLSPPSLQRGHLGQPCFSERLVGVVVRKCVVFGGYSATTAGRPGLIPLFLPSLGILLSNVSESVCVARSFSLKKRTWKVDLGIFLHRYRYCHHHDGFINMHTKYVLAKKACSRHQKRKRQSLSDTISRLICDCSHV